MTSFNYINETLTLYDKDNILRNCESMLNTKPLYFLIYALVIDIIEPFLFTIFFEKIIKKQPLHEPMTLLGFNMTVLTYQDLYFLLKLSKKIAIIIAIILMIMGGNVFE